MLTQDQIQLARHAHHDRSVPLPYLCRRLGVTQSCLKRLIGRKPLPERPEDCEILLPINVLYPGNDPDRCPHGEIGVADRVYCPRCDKTGIDEHHILKRDPRTDPSPEKKVKPTWRYAGKTVVAWTRSEARAEFKTVMGLKRLPPGTKVFELKGGLA